MNRGSSSTNLNYITLGNLGLSSAPGYPVFQPTTTTGAGLANFLITSSTGTVNAIGGPHIFMSSTNATGARYITLTVASNDDSYISFKYNGTTAWDFRKKYLDGNSAYITNAVWNGTVIGSSFITEADPVWGGVSNLYLFTNGNGSALTALPSWAVTNNQPNISGVVMANVTTNLASPTFGGLTLSGNEDVGGNLLTNAQFEARGIPYTVPFATSNDISTLYSLQYYEPTNTTTIYLPAADTNYSYSIRLEVNPGTNSFSIYTNSGVLFTTNDVLGVGSGEVRIPTTMSSVLLLDKPKYNNKWRVWGLQ
jgi:hypothetical protein